MVGSRPTHERWEGTPIHSLEGAVSFDGGGRFYRIAFWSVTCVEFRAPHGSVIAPFDKDAVEDACHQQAVFALGRSVCSRSEQRLCTLL